MTGYGPVGLFCPGCQTPAALRNGPGDMAECPNPACRVFFWDPSLPLPEVFPAFFIAPLTEGTDQ